MCSYLKFPRLYMTPREVCEVPRARKRGKIISWLDSPRVGHEVHFQTKRLHRQAITLPHSPQSHSLQPVQAWLRGIIVIVTFRPSAEETKLYCVSLKMKTYVWSGSATTSQYIVIDTFDGVTDCSHRVCDGHSGWLTHKLQI